jgi:hypothetical protein
LPTQIDYLASVLSPQEMAGHFIAGEWSAAQNIHHLVDSHVNSYVRCRLMLTEEEPPLKPYDQDRWAALPDAMDGDATPSLLILRGLHARWAQFYAALAEEDWERTGSHPERGIVTIGDQLQMYARHGLAHVDQIRRTVAAQYAEPPASLDELLARIDREWDRLGSLFQRMTPAQLAAPLENGWSPKDHMAHVTAWEKYLIGAVVGGKPAHVALDLTPEQAEAEFNALNDILLQAAASKSLAEVQAEFAAVHNEARAAVAGITWSEWVDRTQEWDGQQRPMLDWIAGNSYDHYLEHWQWMPVM